ncbi:unnamed protein product [Adineta ricciae]|uniref:Uncharacterized protein n=1 Tax=Adineta ricciae TaxID=249248 RepID=A0A814PWJ0_ADIRI|nr:unnamed protein product [Adineta ricciae]CAF1211761.1 unnamed protein product [Adineta ricciae]
MKHFLFILLFITVLFVDYSIEQPVDDDQDVTGETDGNTLPTAPATTTTTTPWWTRTFPIIPPRTVTPPPKRPLKTTTPINRVSPTVTIVVPVVLFAITLIAGFGLIAYASFTSGNGVSCLTRTN